MSVERSRDGSFYIRKAITDKLIADFDYTKVSGLSERPVITRTVTHLTPEPYIYVLEVDSEETWVSKTSESRLHRINCQVVIRDEVGRGTSQQRDEMVNEIIENVTSGDDYPDPRGDGYLVQLVTTEEIVKYETVERGAKFYIANIILNITAVYAGFDFNVNPAFHQAFTYAGWHYAPSGGRLEMWDAGTIAVNDSAANSNGWEYVSSTVAKQIGKPDGTLSGRVLTVRDSDEELGLTTTAMFQAISDNTETTTVADTDSFNRIKSLRYGSISSNTPFTDDYTDDIGVRKLEDWNGGNRVLDHGKLTPTGEIEITVTPGDYIYIMYGSDQHALNEIQDEVTNLNILTDVFEDPVIVGDYRYYISKNAANFDNTYTYNLS